MKLLRNSYFFSVISAVVTIVFLVLVVLAASKRLSPALAGGDVPLYNADKPLYAVVGGTNVDKESDDIPPIIQPIVPIVPTAPPASLKITAASYIVAAFDPNVPDGVGSVVVEKKSNQALPIASITKLATAVIAKTLLDQNTTVSINNKILSTYFNDPAGFRPGEEIKVNQLYYPLLMISSNDAGEALAQSYGLGRIWFIKAMNDWAYSIGAYNTYFADPTGLSSENVSSSHDLAIMLTWINTHDPDLIAITATKVKYLGAHTWVSPTAFLNMTTYIGGKNGYLPQAGETSVSLFNLTKTGESIPKQYVVVTLNSQNRDQDVLKLLQEI